MAAISVPQDSLRSFCEGLRIFSQDISVQHVVGLAKENEDLKRDNAKLDVINTGSIESIASLNQKLKTAENEVEQKKSELEKLEKAKKTLEKDCKTTSKEVVELKGQLEDEKKVASDNQKMLNKRQDTITNLQQQLSQARSDYQTADKAQKALQTNLERLQQKSDNDQKALEKYSSLTSNVKRMTKQEIIKDLDSIFSKANEVVVSYFSIDLEEEAFNKVSSPQTRKLFDNWVPLSSSNSQNAKGMRIAAALKKFAEALEDYVFLPSYLLSDNHLCNILTNLAESDPGREAHIRAVLLAVPPQEDSIETRITNCVIDIVSSTGFMLPEDKKTSFKSAVRSACTEICKIWMQLQALRGRISVSFDTLDSDKFMLLSAYLQENTHPRLQLEGLNGDSSNRDSPTKRTYGEIKVADVGSVIWPSFSYTTVEGQQVLRNCVVLSAEQITRARTEVGNHRQKRLTTRRESMSSNGKNGNTKDKSFLSANGVEG